MDPKCTDCAGALVFKCCLQNSKLVWCQEWFNTWFSQGPRLPDANIIFYWLHDLFTIQVTSSHSSMDETRLTNQKVTLVTQIIWMGYLTDPLSILVVIIINNTASCGKARPVNTGMLAITWTCVYAIKSQLCNTHRILIMSSVCLVTESLHLIKTG